MTAPAKKTGRKRLGRPATGRGKNIGVRIHDDILARIDAWCRAQPDAPCRPEAIRRLVEAALQARR